MSETEFETYASKLAIDFAEWLTSNCGYMDQHWYHMEKQDQTPYTMEEIFELYKKLKGL